MLRSSGRCVSDIEGQTASALLLSDASYKLRRKLHQTGNLPEVALDGKSMGNNITTKSGTGPVQKSIDDFWEGDGTGEEYCNDALDREGTAVVTLSKRSLARRRRCQEKKSKARADFVSKEVVMDEPSKTEAHVAKDLELADVVEKNDIMEEELEGCIVIQPYAAANGKRKASMLYNMRRRCRQKLIRHTNTTIETTDTAKFERSSVVHVITPEQLDKLIATKALQVIHLTHPTRKVTNNVEVVDWCMDSVNLKKLSKLDLSMSNVAIVTKYEFVKHDKLLAFVGNMPESTPRNNDHILLGLFLVTDTTNLSNEIVNVQDFLSVCDSSKYNINIGQSSGHYDSQGSSFGFGARREYRIKEESFSSVGSFVAKNNKDPENIFLEKRIIDEMTMACAAVKSFMTYSLHDMSAVQLKVICQRALMAGFADDLHMLGETGYATLFYNFDASTMEKHTEFDMNMTTIFVPNQEWKGKKANHLQFVFHLTGEDSGILSIPMFPGRILYYHGFLLTHQQLHDDGKCSQYGCCLNYSAYANRKLLAHFIKSYQRFFFFFSNSKNEGK